MRILWFSGNTSLYKSSIHGGWIGALERLFKDREGIDLGISFPHRDKKFKISSDTVVYYPLPIGKKLDIERICVPNRVNKIFIAKMQAVIDDFKPDLIHIWGSEMEFGLIAGHISIPVVLHIQGIASPCINAWYPPKISSLSVFLKGNSLKNILLYKKFKNQVKNEREIFSYIKWYMGRTRWDKHVISVLSPNSHYQYCSELLRKEFYIAQQWQSNTNPKIIISTITSTPIYKGGDVILKTSKLLKELHIDFKWLVIGTQSLRLTERMLGMKSSDLNVNCLGLLSVEKVIAVLSESDMYVHTSYIENSPNSVCEAQLLGMPVIATNVGGISSLIEDNETGILLPANDPFQMAYYICMLKREKALSAKLGNAARIKAMARHDEKSIVDSLIVNYKQILES